MLRTSLRVSSIETVFRLFTGLTGSDSESSLVLVPKTEDDFTSIGLTVAVASNARFVGLRRVDDRVIMGGFMYRHRLDEGGSASGSGDLDGIDKGVYGESQTLA